MSGHNIFRPIVAEALLAMQASMPPEDFVALSMRLEDYADQSKLEHLEHRGLPVALITAPLYVSGSLMKFARGLEELPTAGASILFAEGLDANARYHHGGNVRALSCTTRGFRETPILIDWWAGKREEASTMARRERPINAFASVSPQDVQAICDAWIDGALPNFTFAMKLSKPEKVKQAHRTFAKRVTNAIEAVITPFLETSRAAMAKQLDPEFVEAVSKSPIPTIGLYNAMRKPPKEGVDQAISRRNRLQLLAFTPGLHYLVSQVSSRSPFAGRLVDAIDSGEKLPNWLGAQIGVPPLHVRHLLGVKLDPENESLRIDQHLIRSFSTMMSDVPLNRAPKTSADLEIAVGLAPIAPLVRQLAAYFPSTPQDAWESLLKEGWSGALETLAGFQHVTDGGNATLEIKLARARLSIEEVHGMSTTLVELSENPRFHIPEGSVVERPYFTNTILSGKTILRMAGYLRDYRTLQREVDHAVIVADPNLAGAGWTPLLVGTRQVTIRDCTFTELVNAGELRHEGDVMHHCVGGYGANCLRGGSRIFALSRLDGDPESLMSRATLEVRIGADGGVSVNQFYGYRDQRPPQAMFDLRNQFMDAMASGVFPINIDGPRADRARGYQVTDPVEEAAVLKVGLINRGMAFLIPSTHRDQGLSAFLASDAALDAARRWNAAATAIATKQQQAAEKAAAQAAAQAAAKASAQIAPPPKDNQLSSPASAEPPTFS